MNRPSSLIQARAPLYGVEADDPLDGPSFLLAFETALGWMALCGGSRGIAALSFGHRSADAARQSAARSFRCKGAVCRPAASESAPIRQQPEIAELMRDCSPKRVSLGSQFGADRLIARLQAFARGVPDDFLDVPVDFGGATEFTCRVWTACRAIGYGKVATYAELAARVGAPRAARAVGNALAANRVPLIIPCHRVIPLGGRFGRYSAPGGALMKRRLLELEAAAGRVGPRDGG